MKHIGTQTLVTARLTLRRFGPEDAQHMYYNFTGDPGSTRYLGWITHQNVEETQELIAQWEEDYEKGTCYHWAIELNEIEQTIGSISAISVEEKTAAIKIAFGIGRNYWHQGYAAEALAEVMRFFYEEVGANRVWGVHDVANADSGKVMEKCGMRYEGTLKKAGYNSTGIVDLAVYGAVRSVAMEEPEASPAAVTRLVSGDGTVKNVVSDEMMEYVGILAKLELSPREAEAARKDMGEMLDYIDQLNELDTSEVEPMSHIFPVQNVFREDVVTNGDGSADTLANAPLAKDGGFKVPKTIGE